MFFNLASVFSIYLSPVYAAIFRRIYDYFISSKLFCYPIYLFFFY